MDSKNIIIFISLFFLVALIIYAKGRNWKQVIIAASIALAWTTYYKYEYQGVNILLWDRVNVYPLVLWTLGLTLLGQVYARAKLKRHALLIVLLYWAVLICVEAIGYYGLGIRLDSDYASLLHLGVIHAPPVMKIFYLTAGPAFLLISHIDRAGKRYMV